MPRGVKLKEQGGNDKRFKDLYELLANYSEYLIAPLESQLAFQPWFVLSLDVIVTLLFILFFFSRQKGFMGTCRRRRRSCSCRDDPRAPSSFGWVTLPTRTPTSSPTFLYDEILFFIILFPSFSSSLLIFSFPPQAAGTVVHTPIDRTSEGYVCENKPFADMAAWLKSRSAELRYNYDRRGVPLFRVGPLKLDLTFVSYWVLLAFFFSLWRSDAAVCCFSFPRCVFLSCKYATATIPAHVSTLDT